jgi:hypothetical protein
LLTESLSAFQCILVLREEAFEIARKRDRVALSFRVEKTVQLFADFPEAEKADLDF